MEPSEGLLNHHSKLDLILQVYNKKKTMSEKHNITLYNS